MIETIHRCDNCRKLIERRSDVYALDFKSVGWICCPASGRSEHNELRIELCEGCARRVANSLEKMAEAGANNLGSGAA